MKVSIKKSLLITAFMSLALISSNAYADGLQVRTPGADYSAYPSRSACNSVTKESCEAFTKDCDGYDYYVSREVYRRLMIQYNRGIEIWFMEPRSGGGHERICTAQK